MRALAAVLERSDGPFILTEVEHAPPAPDEVVVEVAGVGLCHTDLLARHDGLAVPTVFGHEAAGVVSWAGAGVRGVEVGDAVVVSYDSCGGCRPCRSGQPSYCREFAARNLTGLGVAGRPTARTRAGAPVATRFFGQSSFAERILVRGRAVVPVTTRLPLSLAGPLACSFQTGAAAVTTTFDPAPGDRLLVIGAGAVGLAAVAAGVVRGAEVVVVERHPGRRRLARSLGAAVVLADLADPTGPVHHVLETTGLPAAASHGLAALEPLGILGLVAGARTALALDSHALVGRSVRYLSQGGAVPGRIVPEMLGWWESGRFPLPDLVTTYPLSAINRAEADLARGAVVKAVLLP
ncbi:MAG: alcohol dehydrogenase catalytic domain-containing protein [Propionicimonas sp.]